MLCKRYWIVLYTVHVTAFCLRGRFFGHDVVAVVVVVVLLLLLIVLLLPLLLLLCANAL